jgi:hypothetical protein
MFLRKRKGKRKGHARITRYTDSFEGDIGVGWGSACQCQIITLDKERSYNEES